MAVLNKHITIETVPGKSYCKVEDQVHIYFIPSEMVQEIEDYVHKAMFENQEISSLRSWYLSLSMKKRTSLIVVLNQKIAWDFVEMPSRPLFPLTHCGKNWPIY